MLAHLANLYYNLTHRIYPFCQDQRGKPNGI
jgi:hypothetical protein